MNNFVYQQLQYIITQYGRAICDDHRRCEALLRDLCPENKREVNVLVIALKSKVPEELMKITDAMPKELMLSRLVKRLEDDYGLAEKISLWAVESWALALGIISAKTITVPQAIKPKVRKVKLIQIIEDQKADKAKYQIRNHWLRNKLVSTDNAGRSFKIDGKGRPLKYIDNDYVDNGDGTITDRTTDLMWQKAGSPDYMRYKNAKAYVENLNRDGFAGYRDWRLPTVDELKSLLTKEKQSNDLYIDPIFNKKQRWCWTSDQRKSGVAWFISFYFGQVDWRNVVNIYVRAVRSAQ